MMLNAVTSIRTCSDTGLRRDTRLPVAGFLTIWLLFQTRQPRYSSLLRMPLPRATSPWMHEAAQRVPRGGLTARLFKSVAIERGVSPAA